MKIRKGYTAFEDNWQLWTRLLKQDEVVKKIKPTNQTNKCHHN